MGAGTADIDHTPGVFMFSAIEFTFAIQQCMTWSCMLGMVIMESVVVIEDWMGMINWIIHCVIRAVEFVCTMNTGFTAVMFVIV